MPASPEELLEPLREHGSGLLRCAELNDRLGAARTKSTGVLVLLGILVVALLLIFCAFAVVAGLHMHEGHRRCLPAHGSSYSHRQHGSRGAAFDFGPVSARGVGRLAGKSPA